MNIVEAMNIDRVTVRGGLTTIMARINGTNFEFTRPTPRAAFEVYDYPKTWRGVPRYVGSLSEQQSAKLLMVAGVA